MNKTSGYGGLEYPCRASLHTLCHCFMHWPVSGKFERYHRNFLLDSTNEDRKFHLAMSLLHLQRSQGLKYLQVFDKALLGK